MGRHSPSGIDRLLFIRQLIYASNLITRSRRCRQPLIQIQINEISASVINLRLYVISFSLFSLDALRTFNKKKKRRTTAKKTYHGLRRWIGRTVSEGESPRSGPTFFMRASVSGTERTASISTAKESAAERRVRLCGETSLALSCLSRCTSICRGSCSSHRRKLRTSTPAFRFEFPPPRRADADGSAPGIDLADRRRHRRVDVSLFSPRLAQQSYTSR